MAAELHQQGLKYLLEVALREDDTVPENFYIGLATDESLAENATLPDVDEITGTSYARQLVASSVVGFPTFEATGTNDWHIATIQVTFTGDAANDWEGAKTVFLATTDEDDGLLIASAPLSSTRTLASGDTLKITMTITLTG